MLAYAENLRSLILLYADIGCSSKKEGREIVKKIEEQKRQGDRRKEEYD